MAEESDQLDLPSPLVDALRDAYAHRVEIPASRDQAILAAADAKFSQRRRMRLIARWGTGLAAGIAAMIVVAVSLHHPAATRLVMKGDINADGQVNIVDALALARHLADKDRLDKSWDINADGVIDQRDVDALAQAAVSLKQGGLVNRGLPKLRELGIDRLNVGFASANGVSGVPHEKTFAKSEPYDRHKKYKRGIPMKRLLLLLVPILCLGAAPETASRFGYVDIFIDPKGQAVAAWQLEFSAEVGQISLVGIEASDHAAYASRPAYYDPAALAGNRIILANYSLDPKLPRTKFRVARVMVEIRGEGKPQFVTKLIAAADAGGKNISAELSLVEN